jgi:hypothetical protein
MKRLYHRCSLVLLALVILASTPSQVFAGSGSISGRVTGSDGAALVAVTVTVYNTAGVYVTSTDTDATGAYTTPATLEPGSYRLQFTPSTFGPARMYFGEYYNNQADRAAADPVTVGSGATTGIDAVLQRGATVRGRVTAADTGQGLPNVEVTLRRSGAPESSFARTDADGNYSTTVPLGTGSYRVAFNPSGNEYLPEYYSDKPSFDSATLVAVTAGETVVLDAALTRSATIRGRVTAADTGDGLADVKVYVQGLDHSVANVLLTDVSGSYVTTIPLPAGRYLLHFAPVDVIAGLCCDRYTGLSSAYLAAYAGGASAVEGATPLSIATGASVTADMVLARGGTISGRVTSAGVGIDRAAVVVYNLLDEPLLETVADPSGRYRTPGLPAGRYRLQFSAGGYQASYSGGSATLASAAVIDVGSSSATPNIDAVLTAGGTISGRVTAADSGQGLSGVVVFLHDAAGNRTQSVTTRADGSYNTSPVPAGNYRVEYDTTQDLYDTGGYISAFHGGSTLANATAVTVTSGAETSGIDAALAPGATISGNITGSFGTPPGVELSYVIVRLYDARGAVVRQRLSYAGSYRFRGLPSGTYRVEFATHGALGDLAQEFIPAFYGGASLATATPVSVTAPQQVTNISAVLQQGGRIIGTVRAARDGAPAGGVIVQVYDASGAVVVSTKTYDSGGYRATGLPSGTYRVGFNTDLRRDERNRYFSIYGGAYYGGASLAEATPLQVTAPNDTANIGATLATGALIWGLVSADVGGLRFRTVRFYNETGVVASTALSGDGFYTSPPLAAGQYRVEFTDDVPADSYQREPRFATFMPEFYENKATLAAATPVTVAAGQQRYGINATLLRSASLFGRVTAEDGGAALAGIAVQVLDDTGALVAASETGVDGSYRLRNLTPGVYKLRFVPSASSTAGLIAEYHRDQLTAGTASALVLVGGVSTQIDASLVRGAQFVGTVTAASLLPRKAFDAKAGIAGVAVSVYDESGQVIATATTDAAGNYITAPGVAPGSYKLGFAPPENSSFGPTFFPGKGSLSEAVAFQVGGAGLIDVTDAPIDWRIFLPLTTR